MKDNLMRYALLFSLLFHCSLIAQEPADLFVSAFTSLENSPEKIDSLITVCQEIEDNELMLIQAHKTKDLSEKIGYKKGSANVLHAIGNRYYSMGKSVQALEYYNRALALRVDLGEKKDISATYNNIGNTYDALGNKKEAIVFHHKALSIKEELRDTFGMARSYSNIASAYLDVPDYYKAIDNGFKAIKLMESINNRSLQYANTLNNLGNAYENLKEYEKAMNYYQKALDIQKELDNTTEIARMLSNIANVNVSQAILPDVKNPLDRKAKYMLALDNYSKSLEILSDSDDKDLIANVNSNVGNIYWYLQDFPMALKFLTKSYDVYKEIGDKSGVATALNNFARHYQLQKLYDQSNQYAFQALALADSAGNPEQIKNACEYLSGNYYDLKQFDKSLFYYKRYVAEKDKLTNVEGAKKLVQEESRMEFEKKEQQLKLEQEKKDLQAEAEARQQRLISWSAGIGLLLFIVFSGFIYNRFRVTQKQNKIIEEQKAQMEEKNSALSTANHEIAQKNKDITDSIQYAKRIQRALLASDVLLKKNLPEFFVLYKPKDIVSGDFYWANFVNGKFLIITADCTGHGVPGAFMSLLNISLLNEITLQRKITSPDLILNNVRDQIISILNPEGTETESKDGMDCMLCSFDIKHSRLEFAAANNPLWILRNGSPEIEEYRPDKQPVGFHSEYKPFSLQSTPLEKGDIVYSFTDGFADQFGGPKGKKFKYKQLEELILANSKLPMNEQKNLLEKAFHSWQGDLEQVDDVLVIGVRI